MATGVSGSFTVSGTNGVTVCVDYKETYDITTALSTVTITDVWVKSSSWYGVRYYLNGTVKVAGYTAVSMNSTSGSHPVDISSLGTWAAVTTGTGTLGSISNITHNDDGTRSVSISISVRGYTTSGNYGSGWSASGSKTVKLTTIARKSSLTVSNGTLGTAQTLIISRKSDNFAHSIRYTCGDVDAAIVTKTTDTSVSFTPSLNLAKQNTTGTTVPITFTLYTFASSANDATEIGQTTATITCAIPASVTPSCAISVTDVNNHVATYGGYIQGQSDVEVVVTPTPAQNSSITEYATTIDGKTYKTPDFEVAPITGSGSLTINATVKDQRGRSGTASETIAVLPYSVPAITALSVHRCDSDGTENQGGAYVKVTYSHSITSLSNKNGKTITLKYKKTSETSYTSVTLTSAYSASSATTIFAASTEDSYNVVLAVADNFETVTRSTSVSTAYAFMDWDYGNKTFALGKIAEKTNAFECGYTQYDKFGTLVGNGLAAYSGGGDTGIDPDTTLEGLILTSHTNAPQGLGTFYYIHTTFYNTKSVTAARTQVAHPYNKIGSIYYRYYASGAWSAWSRMTTDADFVTAAGTENPNATTKRVILTNTNTPMGTSYYMYIHTMFNGDPATATSKTQFAIPYNKIGSTYHRYYASGSWSSWRRHLNADESPWTTLWTNASPTSNFGAQTLTISGLSNYNMFKIGFMLSTSATAIKEVEVYISATTEKNVVLEAAGLTDNLWVINRVRSCYITRSTNTIRFQTGNYGYGDAKGSTSDGTIIPQYILGATI